MENIEVILRKIQPNLPQNLTPDNIEILDFAITSHLELTEERLYRYAGDAWVTLPEDLKPLYLALEYFQCIWAMRTATAWDGFLSIFYNFTSEELEHTRRVLKNADPELSDIFEEACTHAAPLLLHEPQSNWVSAHPDGDPYETIGTAASDRITEIEDHLETQIETLWLRTIARYTEAMTPGSTK